MTESNVGHFEHAIIRRVPTCPFLYSLGNLLMAAMELHEALARISLIREQIGSDRDVPRFPIMTVGFSGALAILTGVLQAALVSDPHGQIELYLVLWVGAAAISVVVCGVEIVVRHWRSSSAASRQLTALTVGQFLPCVAAGALVTTAICRHAMEVAWILPSLWAALFSMGVFATYRLLPRSVFWVAVYYLVCAVGIVTLGPTRALSPWTMAGTFGVGQLAAAVLLYLNLERRDDESEHKSPDQTAAGDGRFSYQGLDRVIHEKARLGILTSLVTNPEGLLFNDLKQLCSLTDGNLSRHLGVLSGRRASRDWKEVGGKRTQTMYRLTNQGRKRFKDYIGVLETVVSDAATSQAVDSARTRQAAPTKGKISEGWSPA